MSVAPPTRIAMWSGPRNISTAMMRAWENRADTNVVDEPFYACYLTATEIRHPMQTEILASQSSDWHEVIEHQLQSPLTDGATIQYQKHMTHHMVADIDDDWFATVQHAFLIRHPAEVVASYSEKRETVNAGDLGFARQQQLYDAALALGVQPAVVDAADVLGNPENLLRQLCQQLGVAFSNDMLRWPAGHRSSDGVWAPHWYGNVEKSTGFAPHRRKHLTLDHAAQKVVDECLPYYQALFANRLRPGT
ncbi:MAG: HAD family hydrolase [Gammaproteobacteria bacterium]|nr:HAD family hydrolase [Gammaproteobacteria bacterium]